MSKMRPPFRYFGAKATIAPWILSLFPAHDTYIEPFFGSGAVLFAKPRTRFELVNDLDGQVINFYRVLRNDCDSLVEQLRLTPYAREEYLQCKREYYQEDDPVEMARRFFTVVAQGFAHGSGTASGWACSIANGRPDPAYIRRQVDRLHMVAERMSLTHIDSIDAARFVTLHAKAGHVVYVDPPYLHEAMGGKDKSAVKPGGRGYAVDMTEDDHVRLADALKATDATVFVSGYPSDLYDDIYEGWDQVSRKTMSVSASTKGTDDAERTEVVWSNRPINDGRLVFA